MCDHRPDDGDGPPGEEPPSARHRATGRRNRLDELLVGLARRRRREVLYVLLEHELATVEEVTSGISRRDGEDRETARVDLVHNHLPKLSDRGLIEYDPRSGSIRLTDPGDRVVALVERCRALESDSA